MPNRGYKISGSVMLVAERTLSSSEGPRRPIGAMAIGGEALKQTEFLPILVNATVPCTADQRNVLS